MMQLNEWLKKNKIQHIISIDDEHEKGSNKFNLKYYLERGLKEKYENFVAIFSYIDDFNIDILDEYKDNCKEQISILLDVYEDNTDNLIFIRELNNLVAQYNSDVGGVKHFLDKIGADKASEVKNIKLYKSYFEAYANYKAHIDGLNKNSTSKILWLVDYELVDGDSEKTGLNLIEKIIVENQENEEFLEKNIFVLLSGFQINSTEIRSMKCRIYKIDKLALGDTKTFIKSLINGSKEYISWILVRKVNKSLSDGFKAAESEILSRKQEILDYLIIHYPNKEGTNTLEILVRILQIIARENFEGFISNDIGKLIRLLQEYEMLCESEPRIKSNYLFDLMNKETANKNINKFYNSINSGDIFCISGKHYILLSQPCDISVRGKGERKLERGILVRMTENSCSEKASYELKHFNNKSYYIDYRDCKYVNLDILDLCTLNSEGKARLHKDIFENSHSLTINSIDIEKIENSTYEINGLIDRLISEGKLEGYLNYPMRLKIFKILKKINEVVNIFNDFNKENSVYFKKMRNIIKSESELISFYSYELCEDYIEFKVQRIAALNTIDTYDIINEFSNYTSRIGKPGDITLYVNDESKDILTEDLNSGKQELIVNIKDGSDEDEIKKYISSYDFVNSDKIHSLKIQDKKVIITRDMQYLHIGDSIFDVQNGMIEVSKDFIKGIDKQGIIEMILEEVSKDGLEVKNINMLVNKDKNDIKDKIKLRLGKTRFGNIQINVESSLDKHKYINLGSITIEKIS